MFSAHKRRRNLFTRGRKSNRRGIRIHGGALDSGAIIKKVLKFFTQFLSPQFPPHVAKALGAPYVSKKTKDDAAAMAQTVTDLGTKALQTVIDAGMKGAAPGVSALTGGGSKKKRVKGAGYTIA